MSTLQKALTVVATLSLSLVALPALAQQSASEKAAATGNDVKRDVKKGAHRIDEAGCTGTKAQCDAAKVQHRGTETKDAVVDKTKEVKDKVDPDGKPTK